MLDGKERRDCESRGFCSTQNVSTNHADQTNDCDSFLSWLGLSWPSTRFSCTAPEGFADPALTVWEPAVWLDDVDSRHKPGHDGEGCVFHAARFIRRGRPKAAPNSQ